MERDFEKEFKQLKQSETPDLWNRIEAGLSERKATAFEPGKTNTSTMKATAPIIKVKTDTSEPVRKSGASIRKMNAGKWGTLAAACVCVAIIIPALSLAIRNGGRKNNMSGGMPQGDSASPAMDTATQSAADNGAEMATDTTAEDYAENATVTTEATAEEYEMSDGAESSTAAGAIADVQNTPQEDSADGSKETEKFMQSEEERAENDALNSTDATLSVVENGQVIENVTVEIKVIVETSGQETIYRAVVVEQDNVAVLAKGIQIEIICDSDTEYASLSNTEDKMLKENEKYDVSLRIENGRYIVTSVLSI